MPTSSASLPWPPAVRDLRQRGVPAADAAVDSAGSPAVTVDAGPAVDVSAVRKAYGGRVVLDDVTFSVHDGEIFALVGPNGAGKTTTVEILEGYRRADRGNVRVLGTDPAS